MTVEHIIADTKSKFDHLKLASIENINEIMHTDESMYENNGYSLRGVFTETNKSLLSAALSIAKSKKRNIRIITGFFIEKAGKAETDGPSSAAQLTKFFNDVGIECCMVTDTHCADVCVAAAAAVGYGDKIQIIQSSAENEMSNIVKRWEDEDVTHVITIERPGPCELDGTYKNMKNERITRCAPLHKLLQSNRYTTIGIGDRGNECGFGNIDIGTLTTPQHDLIPYAMEIHSDVISDYLIVSRVSNWAANALMAAVSIIHHQWRDAACNALCHKLETRVLQKMSEVGAVDGITHQCNPLSPTVDSLSLETNLKISHDYRAALVLANQMEDSVRNFRGSSTDVESLERFAHPRPANRKSGDRTVCAC